MRPRVPWMVDTDVYLLEWFEETDIAGAPPKTIYLDIGDRLELDEDVRPAYPTVNRRLNILLENDLVEKHPEAKTHYRLAEKGRDYLSDPNAEVDDYLPAEHLEDDEGDEDSDEES